MKNTKIITIITTIIIAILIISIVIIRMNTSIPFKIETFKHKNISKINFEYMDMYEDYENRYGYYKEKKSPRDGGKYFAAIIDFKEGQTIIEENVMSVKGTEFPIVEAIIYSKQKISKDKAYSYVNYLHDETRCGARLKDYKKLEKGYYYIKYEILDEC